MFGRKYEGTFCTSFYQPFLEVRLKHLQRIGMSLCWGRRERCFLLLFLLPSLPLHYTKRLGSLLWNLELGCCFQSSCLDGVPFAGPMSKCFLDEASMLKYFPEPQPRQEAAVHSVYASAAQTADRKEISRPFEESMQLPRGECMAWNGTDTLRVRL